MVSSNESHHRKSNGFNGYNGEIVYSFKELWWSVGITRNPTGIKPKMHNKIINFK